MVIRDSIRVKSDGKGLIRLVIMRDGNAISTVLQYSFADDKKPIEVVSEETVSVQEEAGSEVDIGGKE